MVKRAHSPGKPLSKKCNLLSFFHVKAKKYKDYPDSQAKTEIFILCIY